jgi:putative membrane protein
MGLHLNDHLANERTFLAYVRTAFAFIGLGFVVARFGLFIRESAIMEHRVLPPGNSGVLGVAMVATGVGLAVFGLYRYIAVRRSIERGSAPGLSVLAAAAVVVILAAIGIAVAVVLIRT